MTEAMSGATGSASGGDMLVVDSPYEVANWRPLVHWIMYIPHNIINSVLQYAAFVVGIVYWVALLVTGRLHKGMYGFLAMQQRYSTRANGFLVGYTEIYAPFDFNMGATDNGVYPPVKVNLPEPPAATPRTAALNFLLAIPHYIVIAIYAIAAIVVLIIGWFAVLFTGAWPAGMRDFLVKLGNYYLRVWAYVVMVETKYPRFGI
jgi:hypothetical protein